MRVFHTINLLVVTGLSLIGCNSTSIDCTNIKATNDLLRKENTEFKEKLRIAEQKVEADKRTYERLYESAKTWRNHLMDVAFALGCQQMVKKGNQAQKQACDELEIAGMKVSTALGGPGSENSSFRQHLCHDKNLKEKDKVICRSYDTALEKVINLLDQEDLYPLLTPY